MKPSQIQILLARRWPWNLVFLVCSLCVGTCFVILTGSGRSGFVISILIGACAGVIATYFILRGLLHVVARMNGGPFHKGDTVQILVGRYYGQEGVIYEEWKDRKQVRVALGSQARDESGDVFALNEICRLPHDDSLR